MATIEKIREEEMLGVAHEAAERPAPVLPSRAQYYFQPPAAEDFEEDVQEAPARPRVKFAGVRFPSEEIRQSVESGNDNLVPTGATLKMLGSRSRAPERPFNSEDEVAFKINSKGKLFFAVYAVAVITLILIIVINAVGIERRKAANAALAAQSAAASAAVVRLSEERDASADASGAAQNAADLGMGYKETGTLRLSLPNTVSQPAYAEQSNWFDFLCDLFS